MFIQFGKDYAGAQSSIEWAEFAGGGLFEIVLTALLLAFTGGLGNAAQIASKVRHAARLRTLGGMLRKLGKLLQRKKLRQKTKGGVDSKHKVTAEKPEGQKLSVNGGKPEVVGGHGTGVQIDGHKIYDPSYPAISTNPTAQYRFSDPSYRSTGNDVYFGENSATAYFEVRKNIKGKSLFVGEVEVDNMLDLTDPEILKQMKIDQKMLSAKVDNPAQQKSIYGYTNEISNQAYDAGYNGIIYSSSRKDGNNKTVVLFGGRYNSDDIKVIMDRPIK